MGKILFLKKSEKEGILLTSHFRCERFNKSTIKMTCIYMGTTISQKQMKPFGGKERYREKIWRYAYLYICMPIYLSICVYNEYIEYMCIYIR